MVPSEAIYLLLLVIGFLSLGATLAVVVSAYVRWRERIRRARRSDDSLVSH
jgi:hypothetical protein